MVLSVIVTPREVSQPHGFFFFHADKNSGGWHHILASRCEKYKTRCSATDIQNFFFLIFGVRVRVSMLKRKNYRTSNHERPEKRTLLVIKTLVPFPG